MRTSDCCGMDKGLQQPLALPFLLLHLCYRNLENPQNNLDVLRAKITVTKVSHLRSIYVYNCNTSLFHSSDIKREKCVFIITKGTTQDKVRQNTQEGNKFQCHRCYCLMEVLKYLTMDSKHKNPIFLYENFMAPQNSLEICVNRNVRGFFKLTSILLFHLFWILSQKLCISLNSLCSNILTLSFSGQKFIIFLSLSLAVSLLALQLYFSTLWSNLVSILCLSKASQLYVFQL